MIDPALLREKSDHCVANFARRGLVFDLSPFLELDAELRGLITTEEKLRGQRNQLSQQVSALMRNGSKQEAQQLQLEARKLGDRIEQSHRQVAALNVNLLDMQHRLPNLLFDAVPNGKSEDDNQVLREQGAIPKFDFEIRDHAELGKLHNALDFETASTMSQSRFVVISDAFARLHRALGQFMLDMHVNEHGYRECNVPVMVNTKALTNTAQLPKFGSDDQFFTVKIDNLHLIPTAEVSLVNMVAGRKFTEDDLPVKLVAHSLCFRREAGSYGKDTRGMLRQHQFEKVELVQIVHPDHSTQAWEQIVSDAEHVLRKLELPYRVVELCSADIGHAAARTIDLEVWLPGQQCYREISSCSNDTDYQARRMKTVMRNKPKNRLVHTLNGSGVALGRALIAVIENNQDAQGSIVIPPVLRPYMGGLQLIKVNS